MPEELNRTAGHQQNFMLCILQRTTATAADVKLNDEFLREQKILIYVCVNCDVAFVTIGQSVVQFC